MFLELGVPVYIADDRARELTNTSERIKIGIIELFGKEAYRQGELDRAYVAAKVFKDRSLLNDLNTIIHPVVGEDFLTWSRQQQAPYVIKEAAILFESGSYKGCDQIILVTADLKERIRRILLRDQTTKEEILDRMANQWSDEKKSEMSDFIIENNQLESTRAQVERIHLQLLEKSR
ncbi:dephospho-CoA kinase [Aureitalea marina]|uniref:dephospho-CoA kinase n=1 Tax=Aureitalea marina TaxID=930804 RepID=UPI0026AA11BB